MEIVKVRERGRLNNKIMNKNELPCLCNVHGGARYMRVSNVSPPLAGGMVIS